MLVAEKITLGKSVILSDFIQQDNIFSNSE